MKKSAGEVRSPRVVLTQYGGIKVDLHGLRSIYIGSMLCSSSSLGEAKPLLQDTKER